MSNLHDFTPEQRKVVVQWANDFRKAMPKIMEIKKAAQDVYDAYLNAPGWHIQEAPKPEQPPDDHEVEPEGWKMGPPKVNFVDKIELTKPEGTQPE